MELTLLFFVVWALFGLALGALARRLLPRAGTRVRTLLPGVLALLLAFVVMRRLVDRAPGAAESFRPPPDATLPLPESVSAAELARLPFTVVTEPGHTARAAFVAASSRRPGVVMALRLSSETTRRVQRYLALHGDTLQLIVDERRRADGRGELYAFALAEVRLGRCDRALRTCSAVATTAPRDSTAAYRILGRFPGDQAFTLRF